MKTTLPSLTRCRGKWHEGLYAPHFTPTYRGFNRSNGFLSGGEDHFFLATVDPKNAKNELGIQIGVVKEGKSKITIDGEIIKKAGYQHF